MKIPIHPLQTMKKLLENNTIYCDDFQMQILKFCHDVKELAQKGGAPETILVMPIETKMTLDLK